MQKPNGFPLCLVPNTWPFGGEISAAMVQGSSHDMGCFYKNADSLQRNTGFLGAIE